MRIQFYDDPNMSPRPREEVRFNQLGLFVYEDRKRVAVGFDITPFLERPTIQVSIADEGGEEVSSLTVIETMQSNFNLTMHLPDEQSAEIYHVEALLYYRTESGARQVVDKLTRTFNPTKSGDQ